MRRMSVQFDWSATLENESSDNGSDGGEEGRFDWIAPFNLESLTYSAGQSGHRSRKSRLAVDRRVNLGF